MRSGRRAAQVGVRTRVGALNRCGGAGRMWLRCVISFIFLGALLAGAGGPRILAADDTTQESQVHGAVIGAVGNLLDNLSAERLTRDLTVGEFLRRTNGADQLARTLERGELLGGPRWIDN